MHSSDLILKSITICMCVCVYVYININMCVLHNSKIMIGEGVGWVFGGGGAGVTPEEGGMGWEKRPGVIWQHRVPLLVQNKNKLSVFDEVDCERELYI